MQKVFLAGLSEHQLLLLAWPHSSISLCAWGLGRRTPLEIPHQVPLLCLHTPPFISAPLFISCSLLVTIQRLAGDLPGDRTPARSVLLMPHLPPFAILYSLSRQGSHTVWLAPQGWATPSPKLQALQHSPLWVYKPVEHVSLVSWHLDT